MNNDFEYIDNVFAIRADYLYDELKIMSQSCFEKKLYRDKKLKKVGGRGCRGKQIYIEYASLDPNDRSNIEKILKGDPKELYESNILPQYITQDQNALKYFADYRYGDNNDIPLPPPVQKEYYNNTKVLNAIDKYYIIRFTTRKRMGGKTSKDAFFKEINPMVRSLNQKEYPHTLFYDNYKSLQRVFFSYKSDSYYALIHKNFGNKSALKVTEKVERLLNGIYNMQNKPYQSDALDIYLSFLTGTCKIYDENTGESFDRNDYFNEDGTPITISSGTVHNWIKKKFENANAADKLRNSELYWMNKRRPYNHRHAPLYSLSKLTMDDIAIPFKRPDGTRVWAYQIFDTQSTAVVGRAYSVDKDVNLLIEALKNLMHLCIHNGWGIPGQIECEQSLANTLTGKEDESGDFEADLLTAGTLFTYVTFCRGGKPLSKRAENFIKQKKYQHQAKRIGFLRRPFAKLEANLLNTDKNPKRYNLKIIIKNEEQDIYSYNNSLHPDQDLYPGKTRWDVLIENINPNLPQPQLPVLAYHIGNCNQNAEVHNSQWLEVCSSRFILPNPDVMKKLKGTTVQAYYIPGDTVEEIYIYQNSRYICTCQPLKKYNEAIIERTNDDIDIKRNYDKYASQFDKITNDTIKHIPRGLVIEPIDAIADALEKRVPGTTPISGEFPNETDIENAHTEAKEYKKAERERKRKNEEINKKHLEYLKQTADLEQYD